jgi:alkylation response protein AidB-like acyl-CoA dehydrogenase
VSLPAGAGSAVIGRRDGDDWVIRGSAAFASGSRYGEWAGVVFTDETGTGAKGSAPELLFGVVRTDDPGVRIDPTWNGMALRASATDHIHYEDVRIAPEAQGVWLNEYRKEYRRPDYAVFSERYREDWVGLSDIWLAAQAVGCAGAALEDVASGVRDRVAIFGVKMSERPMVQVNLGQAAAKIALARSAVRTACEETDRRIADGITPTEADYLRQLSLPMAALELCDDAMRLMLRVLGGNGLREGTDFERRYRDMHAHSERTARRATLSSRRCAAVSDTSSRAGAIGPSNGTRAAARSWCATASTWWSIRTPHSSNSRPSRVTASTMTRHPERPSSRASASSTACRACSSPTTRR